MDDLEKILKNCKTKEDVFDEFKRRIISKAKAGKTVAKSKHDLAEIMLFGRYFLQLESGKKIGDVYFGCGCNNYSYLLLGKTSSGDVMSTDSVEAKILNMFGYRIEHVYSVCSFSKYAQKYDAFTAEETIMKHLELYITLAAYSRGKEFENYATNNLEQPLNGVEAMRYRLGDIVRSLVCRGILKDNINLAENYKAAFRNEMKAQFGQYYELIAQSIQSGWDEHSMDLSATLLDKRKIHAGLCKIFKTVFS